jgi:hypothetical protein
MKHELLNKNVILIASDWPLVNIDRQYKATAPTCIRVELDWTFSYAVCVCVCFIKRCFE